MAATALSVQTATHAGLDLTFSTPTQTTGHTAPTGEGIALLVNNSSGGLDVFVNVTRTVDGLAVATPAGGDGASRKVTVAAGKVNVIPLPADPYADATTGLATFDLSTFANTTLACIKVG